MAMQPVGLIGSAISPTSITSPFGAYGPQGGGSPLYVPGGGGYGVSNPGAIGSVAGGIGFLGAGLTRTFNGLSSSNPASAANILAIQQGAGKGGVGNISAALGAAGLANRAFGNNPAVGAGLGSIGGALQAYQGIQQGGVLGYGNAAVGALRAGSGIANLAGDTSLGEALGSAAGYIAAPLAVYSAIKNWQSGATGSDALQGAEAGAAVGSIIPGVGTVIGAVVGGAIGAISSAFGNGRVDPETNNWQSFINATNGANATQAQVSKMTTGMSPQTSFNLLAGVMDIKDGRIPIVNVFGQKGETTVLNGMTNQINSALSSGKVAKSATPEQLYSQVVEPWLNSKGATITSETGGLQLQAVLTNLIRNWQSGQLTSNTVLTSGGSKDTTLSAYGA